MHIFHHFDSIIWKVDTVLYTSNLDVIWISCWVDTVWLSSLFCQTSFWTTSPAHLARCGAVSTINGSNDLLSSELHQLTMYSAHLQSSHAAANALVCWRHYAGNLPLPHLIQYCLSNDPQFTYIAVVQNAIEASLLLQQTAIQRCITSDVGARTYYWYEGQHSTRCS